MDKINTEIDLITNERDELVHRIGDANRVIKEMEKNYNKLCKTNQKLKEQIDNVRLCLSVIKIYFKKNIFIFRKNEKMKCAMML